MFVKERMNEKEEIKRLLSGGLSSRIIYTLFVYGSKDTEMFRLKDLQDLLSKNGSGQISTKMKDLINLGFVEHTKRKNKFYCSYELNSENFKYALNYKIVWDDTVVTSNGKKLNEWQLVYVPKLDWLEKLYDIKLNQEESKLIFNFFQNFQNQYFPEKEFNKSEFPGIHNLNILDLLKEYYLTSWFVNGLGGVFFGKNYVAAKTYFLNNIKAGDVKKVFEDTVKKYKVNITKDNKHIVKFLLFIDCIDRDKFPNLFPILHKDYFQPKSKQGDIRVLSIYDIISFGFPKFE